MLIDSINLNRHNVNIYKNSENLGFFRKGILVRIQCSNGIDIDSISHEYQTHLLSHYFLIFRIIFAMTFVWHLCC